ncbi:MAG: glutathione synthase [Pseudomonadales bacterium]|nr:glutathione synthase [Pseudomonadales bacterium]
MVHIAFVIDPIETLNLNKDSTLAMIRAAQQREWRISILEQSDLAWDGERVIAFTRDLRLEDRFAKSLDPAQASSQWFQCAEEESLPLGEIDIVMMRKDPPFDMDYIYSTYLLERGQSEGALVVNNPRSLRDCNEKFFATAFAKFQPPSLVSSREDLLLAFHRKHHDVIFKKLDSMGGVSIFRVSESDPNVRVIVETLTDDGKHQIMAQKYIPEIVDGDKRILLINGEPLPYALARIPAAGETRGNLAAGGTGVGQPLSPRDKEIAEALGSELRARGLMFVGIDVIGDYLTEVNVTCPTCIREIDASFGLDIAGMLLDAIEQKLPDA